MLISVCGVEMQREGRGQDQPGVRHEIAGIKDHSDRVKTARNSHLKGALLKAGTDWCRDLHSRCSAGTFADAATINLKPRRWIQVKVYDSVRRESGGVLATLEDGADHIVLRTAG